MHGGTEPLLFADSTDGATQSMLPRASLFHEALACPGNQKTIFHRRDAKIAEKHFSMFLGGLGASAVTRLHCS